MLLRSFAFVFTLMPFVIFYGCSGTTSSTSATPASTTIMPPAENAAPAQPNTVMIDNFTFEPANLTVSVGTTVTWINHDDIPHTATSSADPRVFNSGPLDTDAKFSFTFNTPGTYPYFCAVHPHMTGT